MLSVGKTKAHSNSVRTYCWALPENSFKGPVFRQQTQLCDLKICTGLYRTAGLDWCPSASKNSISWCYNMLHDVTISRVFRFKAQATVPNPPWNLNQEHMKRVEITRSLMLLSNAGKSHGQCMPMPNFGWQQCLVLSSLDSAFWPLCWIILDTALSSFRAEYVRTRAMEQLFIVRVFDTPAGCWRSIRPNVKLKVGHAAPKRIQCTTHCTSTMLEPVWTRSSWLLTCCLLLCLLSGLGMLGCSLWCSVVLSCAPLFSVAIGCYWCWCSGSLCVDALRYGSVGLRDDCGACGVRSWYRFLQASCCSSEPL